MQGVLVIGETHKDENYKTTLFIEAVEFPDGSRRTTHFTEHHGQKWVGGRMVDWYVVYFDEDTKTPVNLYKKGHVWFLDV